MGVDYVARKSGKKRRKQGRQDEGKDGVAIRERRRKKIRRLCNGACYKAPELTAGDMLWPTDGDDDAAAHDSDIEEAAARAKSHRNASTSGVPGEPAQPQLPPSKKKLKDAKKRKLEPDAAAAGDAAGHAPATANGGAGAQPKKLSTSIQLLDPAVLAHNARQAALRKLPPGASAQALERFPPLLQACMLGQHHLEPTPVQEACWTPALGGRDVQAVAEPGSGKTLAYLLPALAQLMGRSRQGTKNMASPDALVLVPTRELAEQVLLPSKAAAAAALVEAARRRLAGWRCLNSVAMRPSRKSMWPASRKRICTAGCSKPGVAGSRVTKREGSGVAITSEKMPAGGVTIGRGTTMRVSRTACIERGP
ncbi:putative ATP-dependent RNA helicase [Tetrabaena socialis]|uniref:ATP-dependent RNA helicase n=1 Tax=Tetrabaena socialis TaxID=47790 RepID=A0A2J8AAL4_9CHLO|nr:putative ATP-dependent RNA helicase [Tetrabaena socialis]|eukprot:PNH09561.1 putative ATP-dependent RNA helicase [Tetrabaena socialis]